ncbi:Coenzyme PQQ synthesis protein D (PqqD) [Clostridiales bacterium CHKCI001]|nr:Coenzyme PQQ synthesis protein D (PqqD) [Clostridiales bacterium CHKCI001]
MRVKEGFILRKIGDQSIVVAIGEASKSFHGMLHLNDTGSFLWEQLEKEKTEEELIQVLLQEYEVSRDQAQQGVEKFLNSLREANCIEE